MKKYFLLSIIIFFSISVSAQSDSPIKIGYLDSEVILKNLPEAIKAQGEINALVNKWQDQIDSMTVEFQKELADYQKNQAKLTEAKRQETEQKLVQKRQMVEEFQRSKFDRQGGELYKRQEELLKPVKDKIYSTIEVISKEEGMKFVFDKSGDIILLYADSEYDITYKVLDRLKRTK